MAECEYFGSSDDTSVNHGRRYDNGKGSAMRISVKLWTINNLLRFTGFRIFCETVIYSDYIEDSETGIGIMWWGSPFNDGSNRKKVDNAV